MNKVCIQVAGEPDIVEVARQVRQTALALRFSAAQAHYIATAASELAANLFIHADGGVIEASCLKDRSGIERVATDQGPGIGDIDKVLRGDYSTADGLGCGLLGVQRLMDEMDIDRYGSEGA